MIKIGTLLIGLCVYAAPALGNSYTAEMFRHAMAKDSALDTQRTGATVARTHITVTPLFVLIIIRHPEDNTEREVCTLTSLLQGAIGHEYNVGDDAEIFKISMLARNRVFTFHNHQSRRDVAPMYTERQLNEVRSAFLGHSVSGIRKAVKEDASKPVQQQSTVTRIYSTKRGKNLDSYRFAVAHALLERGIQVGDLHDTGLLYLDDSIKP